MRCIVADGRLVAQIRCQSRGGWDDVEMRRTLIDVVRRFWARVTPYEACKPTLCRYFFSPSLLQGARAKGIFFSKRGCVATG